MVLIMVTVVIYKELLTDTSHCARLCKNQLKKQTTKKNQHYIVQDENQTDKSSKVYKSNVITAFLFFILQSYVYFIDLTRWR